MHELLNHLVEKHQDNFNIEIFKRDYYCLGRDLLFEMEQAFQNYLTTFFQDEGFPVFASIINEGGKICRLENLLYDLKSILKPNISYKLYENAVFYAPPYFPLCAFKQK